MLPASVSRSIFFRGRASLCSSSRGRWCSNNNSIKPLKKQKVMFKNCYRIRKGVISGWVSKRSWDYHKCLSSLRVGFFCFIFGKDSFCIYVEYAVKLAIFISCYQLECRHMKLVCVSDVANLDRLIKTSSDRKQKVAGDLSEKPGNHVSSSYPTANHLWCYLHCFSVSSS